MFRTRIRKILRDVWARKGRTFLVSAAIFIGVTGTIALFSMSDILVSQLREDIKEDELSMLDIYVTVNAGTELDNDAYFQSLRDITGVTEIMGAVGAIAQFKLEPEDEDYIDGNLTAYSIPYEDGFPIEPMRLLDGGSYPAEGANEIAIEQRMADKYGLDVGDQIYFRILSPSRDESLEGATGTVEAWTVSGIVFHAYAGRISTGPTASPDSSIYARVSDANYIGGLTGYNVFRARFVDYPAAEAQSEHFTDFIANDTPYIPVFIQTEDPAQNSLIQSAQTMGLTMSTLALIALIVSGFLVINVITSIVVEQKRQIGVMKSMGATRMDNFFMYAGIAFTYGLIAVIPGLIIGIPGGYAIAQQLAPTLNTVLDGFTISPSSIILGVIVGLVIPVLAAIIPVYFGTRVQILDAMTDLGIDVNYGKGPLARIIKILPVPITIRQGLSNISLKKTRLLFTVITLSIAAGAFMGIYALFVSLTDGIQLYLDSFNVEIGVFPNEAREPKEITSLLEENFMTGENPVIKSVEPGFQLQVEFEGYEQTPSSGGPPGIFAYGYAVESETPAFDFTVDEGEPLSPDNAADGIILSSLLATNMDKELGDTVIMKVPGNRAELVVVGISEYPLEQVWLDWRTLALISNYTVGAPTPNEYFTTVTANGYEGTLPDNQVVVLGLDTQLRSFITFEDGEFFTPGEPGIIINQGMADMGGYSVGDTLTLTSAGEAEYPITGIFQLPPIMQGADGAEEIPADFAAMFWQDLARLEDKNLNGEPLPQGYFLISTIDNPSVDDLDEIIDDIDQVMLSSGISVFNFNFVELVEQISEIFTTIQIILQLVAGLIALVGALGLLTTLSMSVFERQKEIGVMRSIGAGSMTVASQFLTEGIVVGGIAWIVGLPLAALIQLLLLNVTGFDETFPFVFSIEAAIIGLIGMIAITTIASIWPSLGAARKTVSDILRYQ